MRCPQCQTENRADRKFCAACGAALERACGACGFKNAASDRFCGGCGKGLDESAPAAAATGTFATQQAERRPVAVLIADLANYTRLSTGRDPEDTQRLLARYFQTIDPIVLQHGGTIDKHMGDAMMALFGAPTAHGDDALRAARAAIAIHQSLADLSRELGETLSAHIGIALGEVLAGHFGSTGHAAYTVTGEAPTLAARLMGAAPAGETWVDDAIAGEIAGQIPCRRIDALTLKGLDAVTAHAILGADATQQPARRMIGRRGELAQITALMAEAGEGNGGTILVRGDPGIGKSTLLQEAAQMAERRGFAVAYTRVLDFGATRETAVATLLCAHLLRQCTGQEEGEAGLAAVLASGTLPHELSLFAADLLSLPRSADDLAVYRSMDESKREGGRSRTLQSLLAAAAKARPQLILVEDLHWADEALLVALALLSGSATDAAALLLFSSRLDGDPIDAAWRARAKDTLLATIDLRPLSGADCTRLAQHLSAESDDYMRRCVERAEGNPLFLEQLLRSHATDQAGHLPPSVHGVVLARLDRLGQSDRRAIEAAAILGQRFHLSDLRRLIGDDRYEAAELARRHLTRPEGAETAFAHALIRDGVYASLTLERRAQLHRAAAALFAGRDPAVHAEHLERAGDPSAALAYLEASRIEAGYLHVARALALAERGLAIARDPSQTFQLGMQVGRLQRDLGHGEPALAAFTRAHEIAGDALARTSAMIGMASANRLLGRVQIGLEQANSLVDAIAAAGNDAMAAEFHTLRGNLAFSAGDLSLCNASHHAALAAADSAGSVEHRIRALGGLGDAAYASGHFATAQRSFAECAALADANGFIRIASPNRGMLANCEVYFLRIGEALKQCALALEGAQRIGDRYLEMFAKECAAFGPWVAEQENLFQAGSEALTLSRALKADRFTYVLLVCIASSLRNRAPHAEIAALCQEALEIAERTSMTFAGPMIFGVYALIEPDPARQREWIAKGEALLAKSALAHNQAYFYRFAIDWAIEHGHWSEAERFADALESYFAAREMTPYITFLVDRARLLAAVGRSPNDNDLMAKLVAFKDQARAKDMRVPFPPLND